MVAHPNLMNFSSVYINSGTWSEGLLYVLILLRIVDGNLAAQNEVSGNLGMRMGRIMLQRSDGDLMRSDDQTYSVRLVAPGIDMLESPGAHLALGVFDTFWRR